MEENEAGTHTESAPAAKRSGRSSVSQKAAIEEAQKAVSEEMSAPEAPSQPEGGVPPPADALHRLAELRHNRDEIRRLFEQGEYPYRTKIARRPYEAKKAELQIELLKLQEWVKASGTKIVMIFEGRDAAGKGGTIKRFMEHLNPRYARVVALTKPSETEKGQWFFQRYIQHLPTTGEIVFFDRSWYHCYRCMAGNCYSF